MASKKRDHESMHGTQSVIYKSVRYTFNCSMDNKKKHGQESNILKIKYSVD